MSDKKLDELLIDYAGAVQFNFKQNKEYNAIIDYVLDDKSDLVRRNNELDNIAHDLEYKLQEAINRADADYNEALREGHNDGYQDALKPIREVWEKYKDEDGNFAEDENNAYYGVYISYLWQAIKTALGEK